MDYVRKITNHLPILIILALALTLRVFWLAKSPPALNWDETALGYNAYSIMQTSKDEFGKVFPISLRSFDDYKPALYSYLTIPFIKVFGLTEVAIRLPSALAGTLLVPLVYLITYELTKDKKITIAASLLLAIEPWALLFSRAAFETNLALVIYLSGLYLLIKTKLTNYWSIIGMFLLTLSAYAYHAEKILFLPTIILVICLYRKNIRQHQKIVTAGLVICAIILIPLISQSIIQKESLSRLGSTFYLSWTIFGRYISYFSPASLFVRGSPEPTQSIPNIGMFHQFEFIFWLIGLFTLAKNRSKYRELILLMLISPLPAIITWNWFYPARVLPLFVFFTIIVTIGVAKAVDLTLKKSPVGKLILAIPALTLVLINLVKLTASFAIDLPVTSSGNWQFGMKQIVTAIADKEAGYQNVIIETRTAQPYIFVLFYSKYPPERYQKEISQKAWLKGNRTEFDFGKYSFRDIYWPENKKLTNTLLVGPKSGLPDDVVKNNPKVDFYQDITDPFGNILSRMVGLK